MRNGKIDNRKLYSRRFTVTKIGETFPQRYPFLFFDEIEWATKAEIKGRKTYDNTFLLSRTE